MYSMIPFSRGESNVFRLMDDIQRSFFDNTVSGKDQFRCDISEKDGDYLLEAELPGFSKEDISVQLNGDMLTISANHEENKDETDKNGNYIRRERRYGSYSRSFNIEGIDTNGIKADYKSGVLNLTLPKSKSTKPETRKIEIGG